MASCGGTRPRPWHSSRRGSSRCGRGSSRSTARSSPIRPLEAGQRAERLWWSFGICSWRFGGSFGSNVEAGAYGGLTRAGRRGRARRDASWLRQGLQGGEVARGRHLWPAKHDRTFFGHIGGEKGVQKVNSDRWVWHGTQGCRAPSTVDCTLERAHKRSRPLAHACHAHEWCMRALRSEMT